VSTDSTTSLAYTVPRSALPPTDDLAMRASRSPLLAALDIDGRRVAVERNLDVVKRALFDTTEVRDGDAIEIVNFVGGG